MSAGGGGVQMGATNYYDGTLNTQPAQPNSAENTDDMCEFLDFV